MSKLFEEINSCGEIRIEIGCMKYRTLTESEITEILEALKYLDRQRQWDRRWDAHVHDEEPCSRPVCPRCGGTKTIRYYYDAGDHFGAGAAPNSEWRETPCDVCQKGR